MPEDGGALIHGGRNYVYVVIHGGEHAAVIELRFNPMLRLWTLLFDLMVYDKI
ncbi:hypothetical protein [Paenibacillus xylanexedens]|uniref:hypothetical protein n=1 Tax=Paenibacillus xylanexedens TaxID=528191 RepID=UPI001C930146|nr:hypothetical protein [Paenibacillus xylanexedens]